MTSERDTIQRARHLAHCFTYPRPSEICTSEGITPEDQAEGFRLAAIDKDLYHEMCWIFGRPEYGSWPESSIEYKKRRFDEMNVKSLAGRL